MSPILAPAWSMSLRLTAKDLRVRAASSFGAMARTPASTPPAPGGKCLRATSMFPISSRKTIAKRFSSASSLLTMVWQLSLFMFQIGLMRALESRRPVSSVFALISVDDDIEYATKEAARKPKLAVKARATVMRLIMVLSEILKPASSASQWIAFMNSPMAGGVAVSILPETTMADVVGATHLLSLTRIEESRVLPCRTRVFSVE